MKKMFTYVLIAIVCAFAGFATAALLADSKHADEKSDLQIELDKAKHNSLLYERQVDKLIESKAAVQSELEALQIEYNVLEATYGKLGAAIMRIKNIPVAISLEKEKLLKERLPYGMTNTLRFMDYSTITDKDSIQYRFQEDCETNYDTGIRTYYVNETETDYYCVALGSAYGRDIGDTWHVKLECGTEFNIILSEFKDDGTTDYFGQPDKNYDGEPCTSVIEFVVDTPYMPSSVISAGTYTALGGFGGLYGKGGNIIEMKYLGRVWE